MAQKEQSEQSRPGASHLKWMLVVGMVLIFFVVIGITSSRSIHGVLAKQSSPEVSGQPIPTQPGR